MNAARLGFWDEWREGHPERTRMSALLLGFGLRTCGTWGVMVGSGWLERGLGVEAY